MSVFILTGPISHPLVKQAAGFTAETGPSSQHPLDSEFYQKTTERSTKNLTNRLFATLSRQDPDVGLDGPSRKSFAPSIIANAVSAVEDLNGGEFGTNKVIDIMETYYELCRQTFTENVLNLVVESCLVRDIPNILTPTEVGLMSAERLNELAAESEDAQSRREQLGTEIDILRQGLEQCRRYKPRLVTILNPKHQGQAAPAPRQGQLGSTPVKMGKATNSIFNSASKTSASKTSASKTSASKTSASKPSASLPPMSLFDFNSPNAAPSLFAYRST
ncbi:hypothetical protein HIM_07439 [Hirsutella minnesotensis 3608]|uniref:GED domain-containing protein n=1 Tax=Hirsutella minnesotensis 3608 TaxID=1043627 RepID=A0A0F7ZYX7_9HYPO|nr:hypothetical protein HIM_07439 [Hirsutella minnesotensis 3608]